MKYPLIMMLAGALSTVSFAQEPLTLEKAVATALNQNHTLRGVSFNLESAHWSKRNAVTNFLPKVEVSSDFTRIDPESDRRANAAVDFIKASAGSLGIPQSALAELRPFAYRESYSTNVTVIQPIYNGGAEIVGLEAANAMQDKNEFAYEDTEQDVVARVKIAYLNVLKSEEFLSLAKESAERTRRWLEMTERRAALGTRTHTDVLRFEVQLAADEGNIINAENLLATGRLQLNEVMGVPLETHYTLQPVSAVESVETSSLVQSKGIQIASLQSIGFPLELDRSFLDTHPSMRMMEANLRLADANISRAWVNFKPRINLAFQYGWEKNNTLRLDGIRPWALSLSVSLPVFNGFGDYTNLERTKAEYRSAEQQVESFRRTLLVQANSAQLNARATQKRIEIAKKGLEQAEEVLNSVTRRYDLGNASNVDLIDAQTAYNSSKTSYITAVYDNKISQVQLARATGKMTL